ncbi:unnamed protein product [Durusdinium trenchii]|uniref:non-specific serine/threonine protein kinase n=1 Tax=Durusdinium trenchii TaxID=1381693 RepID=A0ABP0HJA9_9DINO
MVRSRKRVCGSKSCEEDEVCLLPKKRARLGTQMLGLCREGLLPSSAVQKARLSLLRGLQSLGLLAKDTPLEEGKAAPKSAGKAADATADVRSLASSEVLALLNHPDLFLFLDHFLNSPAQPVFDSANLRAVLPQQSTGFHTDSVYMGRLMQQPTELLAVWIPVTEIPLEMGGLVLCRGSNSHPGFEHFRATYGRLDLDEADVGGSGWFTEDPREIIAFGGQMETAHFRPGDVVLFTMHSIHGSSVNCTDRYRLSMDFRVRAERVSDVEQSQKKGRWSRLRHDAAEFPRTMEEAKAAWKLLPSGKENVPAPSSPCSPATPLTPRTPRQLPRELKKAHVLEFPRELSSREPRIGLSPTPLGERFATPPRHHAPPPAPALGAPVPRDPALGAAVVPAAPPPSPREAKRNAGLEGGRKFAEVVGKALHVYPRSNAWRFLGRQVSVWFVLTRWDLAGFHCTLPPSVLLAAVVAAFEEENKAQILEEAVAMATEEKQLRTEEEELHDEHVALLDRLSRLQAEALSSGEEQATLRERFEEATRELQATAKTVGRGGVKHQDHLSRAQDIFTFWFYEVRDRARCALPRFRRSEVLPILGVVLDVFWAPVLEVGWRWTYGWKDFEFGEQLGRGSFGARAPGAVPAAVVFKVLRKEDAVTCGRDVFGALGTVRPPPSHPRSMPREWGEVCKQIQLSEMKKKARLEANQEGLDVGFQLTRRLEEHFFQHLEVELLRKVSRGCSYIVQYLGSFLERSGCYAGAGQAREALGWNALTYAQNEDVVLGFLAEKEREHMTLPEMAPLKTPLPIRELVPRHERDSPWEEGETLHIIMEFCEKGDLSQFLKSRHSGLEDGKRGEPPEPPVRSGKAGWKFEWHQVNRIRTPRDEERSVWRYLLQIALGLQWLHQNRILHRDIKTLNVFLKTNDDVRLGDLGVARVLSGSNFANTFVGTPYYLSPEICEEKPYNELSDVPRSEHGLPAKQPTFFASKEALKKSKWGWGRDPPGAQYTMIPW